MDLTKSDVDPLFLAADGIVLGMNGEMMTEEWTLFPGRYRVMLTGSGFDHSYIYARTASSTKKPTSWTLTSPASTPTK